MGSLSVQAVKSTKKTAKNSKATHTTKHHKTQQATRKAPGSAFAASFISISLTGGLAAAECATRSPAAAGAAATTAIATCRVVLGDVAAYHRQLCINFPGLGFAPGAFDLAKLGEKPARSYNQRLASRRSVGSVGSAV